MLDDSYISEIYRRVEAATPGPWVSFIEKRDGFSGSDFIQTSGDDIYLTGATVEDYEFIAHARQDIPALICEIWRLRSLVGG